jgi:hypothetical protein
LERKATLSLTEAEAMAEMVVATEEVMAAATEVVEMAAVEMAATAAVTADYPLIAPHSLVKRHVQCLFPFPDHEI